LSNKHSKLLLKFKGTLTAPLCLTPTTVSPRRHTARNDGALKGSLLAFSVPTNLHPWAALFAGRYQNPTSTYCMGTRKRKVQRLSRK
jgi:hypothetical protein